MTSDDIDECASNPCHHGARCDDLVGDYECRCDEVRLPDNDNDENNDDNVIEETNVGGNDDVGIGYYGRNLDYGRPNKRLVGKNCQICIGCEGES